MLKLPQIATANGIPCTISRWKRLMSRSRIIFRRETRAWLEANCPPEMRQPMTSDERHMSGAAATRSSRPSRSASGSSGCATRGWTVPDWPKEYGGGGLDAPSTKMLRAGNGGDLGARTPLSSLRHLDARAGAAEIRHRRAEEGASAEDRRGRDPLVPGLFRAERRLRPRLAADPGRERGRRLSHHRPEDLDRPTPTTPTGSSAWSAPIAPARSTTASASSCSTWPRRASRPSRSC